MLILDNVEAHITIITIDLARENRVVLLTLPPHTSHRLQPLDRAVHGPSKKAYNVALDAWIRSHPGRTATIYEIPAIVTKVQLSATSQRNIKAGFATTGIYPYNTVLFKDADIVAAEVTDHQNPETEAGNFATRGDKESFDTNDHSDVIKDNAAEQQSTPSTSAGTADNLLNFQAIPPYVSLSAIYPLPKTQPRKTKRGKKKGATKNPD